MEIESSTIRKAENTSYFYTSNKNFLLNKKENVKQ